MCSPMTMMTMILMIPGDVLGFVFTIEFQKHGLLHIHLLLFLRGPFNICDAAHVDFIVSAEIPNPVTHPMLYTSVTKCMTYGPCSDKDPYAPCMVEGKCSKHYPKEFTHFGQYGYPEYAKCENGRTYTNCKGHTFDNHSIIPYNAHLSARYHCHINVEICEVPQICASIKAIKYIHIYKGHDQATFAVGEDIDEILDHIGGYYVGPVKVV